MILDQITDKKRETLKEKKFLSKEEYKNIIDSMKKPVSFYEAIKKEGLSIIGEIKKASPSKGIIKKDFNPRRLGSLYNKAVDAISVLTEKHFFMGDIDYLRQASEVAQIPILRKDFIIDERQIYEARINGASSVLLITSILKKEKLKEFIKIVHSLDLDALLEVHTKKELYIALECGAKIIGINNRNLKDFSVDLNTTLNLKKDIPKDILVVSESGIKEKEDIKFLKDIDGILVGESFMKSKDILKKAKELKEAYEYKG
ncbi:indole-3-glycerol phosphate synthase TrpC [Clostridium oceanicum]|uniref:Indole-3-glycerol phosphate synthase n=1 Tax=Clostridium oceanicum TaxID=1543 RepID=A0ABN1JF66_9CLOT